MGVTDRFHGRHSAGDTPAETILALDLATKTGWALVRNGRIYESGVWNFKAARGAGHYGHLFQALYLRLDEYVLPDTRLAYELAHHQGGASTRVLVGLNSIVLLFAARRGMPTPHTPTAQQVKAWACGHRYATKADVKAWAAVHLGRPPIDDNEADAVAVGLWAAAQNNEVRRDSTAPGGTHGH